MTGIDPMRFLRHAGLLDQALEGMGLGPAIRGETPAEAEAAPAADAPPRAAAPDPRLAGLARTLETERRTSRAFQEALEAWPDDVPIWDHLSSERAKRNFAEHVLLTVDDTDQRPYASFPNLCKGFATQVFMRLSEDAPSMGGGLRERLAAIKIDAGSYPAKLRMPVTLVNKPGHEYNAVLLDDEHPGRMESYLFYDSTNGDKIIDEGHPLWGFYTEKGVVQLARVTDADPQGGLKTLHTGGWVQDKDGRFRRVSHYRVAQAAERFFIADPIKNSVDGDTERWTRENYAASIKAGGSFEGAVRLAVKPLPNAAARPLTDNQIVELGKLLVGRRFRTSPDAAYETMTAARFVELIARPDLRSRIG